MLFLIHLYFDCDCRLRSGVEFSMCGIMSARKSFRILEDFAFQIRDIQPVST
jgi:hypothetical protein